VDYKHTDIVRARDRHIPALRGKNDASDGDLTACPESVEGIPFEQGTRCPCPPRCIRGVQE
jgi:hypothetical protein